MTSITLASPFTARPPTTRYTNKESVPKRCASILCKANDDQNPTAPKLERRNVLLGLGGLYGAAAVGSDRYGLAQPILPPDLSKCSTPSDLPEGVVTQCCPPYSPKSIEFRGPGPSKLRVRPAAHKASPAYIAKYEKAMALMKALPQDDPRSFMQQANVHCAYCNGAYDQVGFGDLDIQVHNSWLFFPFHRWYLYFYERILGKLINDPTFAIPFWNWDAPAGMKMPAMFTNPSSSLFNVNRSTAHQPPYLMDLDYDYKNAANNVVKPDNLQIPENLATMYRQMVSGAKIPSLFFGGEYRAGDPVESSPGSIENTPHTQIHVLCGSESSKNGEDMGNFYSAGRDPIFYAHHGNVDRMWSVWKTLGGKRSDIKDTDWLDAAFLFYDENAQLVRVAVRDCLDTKKLGYVYEDVDIPWLSTKPKPKRQKSKKTRVASSLVGVARAAEKNRLSLSDFPITLKDSPVSVEVQRPKAGRTSKEKEEEEEVLVVEGIDFDRQVAVKFDVYLDDEDEGATTTGPDKSEYAGTFGNVPHKIKNISQPHKVSLRLGISDLLDDIGADDDDSVIVTLVPRTGDPVSIDGMKILLLS